MLHKVIWYLNESELRAQFCYEAKSLKLFNPKKESHVAIVELSRVDLRQVVN